MKPILFNTEMVKAILDGRKTMTRRIIKPQPINGRMTAAGFLKAIPEHMDWGGKVVKPPYQPGDILYVRETFCPYDVDHVINGVKYAYKADSTPGSEETRKAYGYKWKPSIFMPKEAARVFLRVIGVKAERLQDITDEEAEKEGCNDATSTAMGFSYVWDSTVKKVDLDKYGWGANPWVWVYEFERCEKPKEELPCC